SKTLDRVGFGVERLEHRQQLGDVQHFEAAQVKVAQLQVSVVPVERHVLARDQADAGAVQICHTVHVQQDLGVPFSNEPIERLTQQLDRKSTRLNSSHVSISYAVFCLKKKKVR